MARLKLIRSGVYDKVNQDSKDLLDDYILELEAQGKSKGTIYQYTADIKGFLCWVYSNLKNEYILKLKKRDFRKFFLTMMKHGCSAARVNRFQSSIRNILEYAANEDDDIYDYDVNEAHSLKGLSKSPVRKVIFLEDDKVTFLINELMSEKDYQLATFVSLAYDSAARRNELRQVNRTTFEESNSSNTVRGKRGKKFKLMYFDRTKECAKKWLDMRDDDCEALFIDSAGSEVTRANNATLYGFILKLRKILKKKYGRDIHLKTHDFRHSALENYSNGSHYILKQLGKDKLPLNILKVIAHHSSIDTTQSYLEDHDDDILEQTFGIDLGGE